MLRILDFGSEELALLTVADLDAAIKGLVKADGQRDANDDKDEKEGGIPVWVWIVIAAAVVIAAVVIVILVLSKKKKTKI